MRTFLFIFVASVSSFGNGTGWSQVSSDTLYNSKELIRFLRYPVGDSLFLVQKGENYGIVNGLGELQVPLEYDEIKTKLELREVGLLEKMYRSENEKIYYYWENGWESQEEFDSLQKVELEKPFSALRLEKTFRESPFFAAKKSGVWGVVNAQNDVLIPFEYTFLEEMGQDLFIGKKEGSFEIITPNNEVLISQCDTVLQMGINNNSIPYGNEFAAFSTFIKNGKYGAINIFNGAFTPPKYDRLEYMRLLIEDGWVCAFDIADINYGYTPEERLRKHLYHNVLIFELNDKFGLLNTVTMEEILPAEYNFIDMEGGYGGQIVQVDSMYTFLCDDYTRVFEGRFDTVSLLDQRNLFKVVLDGEVGVYDRSGTCLADVKYEDVKLALLSSESYSFVVRHKGKYGVVNGKGRFVLRPRYDAISYEYDREIYRHTLILERNGKKEIIGVNDL